MPLSPDELVRLYTQAKSLRAPHENDWRSAAAHVLPAQYSSWQTDGPVQAYGRTEAVRRIAYDTTGMRSLPKYVAILERLMTPASQKWHGLQASDQNLRRKARVRKYFDELTDRMFKMRYSPRARFRIATSEMYQALGVYGNGPLFIGERAPTPIAPVRGIKYISCPLRDVFILVDDDGEVCGVFRRFWLNVRQFKMKFPNVPMPAAVKRESEKSVPDEGRYFEFVHYVAPRDNYDPQQIDARRHPIVGVYVAIEDKAFVGDETGYKSMPYKIPRVATVSGDPYGYSPAMMALAAMGGASQMKKTNLKQGNKAVDPPLIAHNDNTMNGGVDLRPGAINYGGVDRQGRELIKPLRGGDFRVAEVLLQDERKDVEDSFFVTLFQILTETPEMTATEVVERIAEKAALLSPTMGRLQSEFGGPTIERELDVMSEIGQLPEMPPELIEAQGEYEIVYTSPLAKSMYAEEVSGFMRSVEMSLSVAQATQDMSALDHYNFEVATPEIASYLAVPARWMRDENEIRKTRDDRQKANTEAQMMQNAPALASAAKTVTEMGKA